MSETKQAFSIDKPGAYKLRGGGIADILGVNAKSAFGWLRSDTCPMSMRRWDRTGIADAGCWDIIEAIPFVVDGPGRYMMRNGRVAEVGMIAPSDKASQPVRGVDGSANRTWHLDGRWSCDHKQSSYDLVRKMHPLEQEPVAKASEAPKAPEAQAPLDKPVFRITEPGVYCTRNGRVVNIHEVTSTTAHGHWQVSGNKREWPLNGRTHASIDLGSDIVMKAPPVAGVIKITDVVTRLRTDWDRRLAEQEEQALKKSQSTKTPETPKTPPTLHDVIQGIEGKPTQQPSEEQLNLAYKEPERAAQLNKAPAFSIDAPGVYRTRDGRLVDIEGVGNNAVGTFVADPLYHHFWNLDGRTTSGLEASSDIIQKIKSKHPEPPAIGSRDKTTAEVTKAPEIKKEPKKPTVAITQTGKYRTRDGRLANIAHIGRDSAIGHIENVRGFSNWWNDGRYNEHCESNEDIVEMVEQHVETKTLDPVAKWSEEAMGHIEEYVAIMKEKGGPMDPLIEDALRVLRPDLCPPKAGQEKTGAEVMDALGKAATRVADEPKKPSAGFDMVMIQNHGALYHITVAGVYSINNGVATVLPVEGDMTQVAIVCGKFPEQYNVMMLTKGDRVTCPAHNVTCVIHCGGEDASEKVECKQLTISHVDAAFIEDALKKFDSLTTNNSINLPYELDFSFRESLKILKRPITG